MDKYIIHTFNETILTLNRKEFEIILNWFENNNYDDDYLIVLSSVNSYYKLSINNNILNQAKKQLIK